MDYHLHLNFFDLKTKQKVLKSYEVVKPLGLIEIVPSPYVTESTRIAILLPTFKTQIQEAASFIKRYEKVCMENQDNTFLMLVFMYPAEAPSKGEEDMFVELKTLALDLSEKFKSDNSRIAWVSIRLPPEFVDPSPSLDDVALTSVYGATEILGLAVTDLALRKIGLESLVMVCSNSMTFKADFLNRVRMNTIQGFQVFSPIGFMMYPCRFTGLCKECSTCDVGQSSGYFDRKNYDVVSFYSRDYVDARKRMESEIPIVHNDHDIVGLMNRTSASMNVRIVDLFLQPDMPVHVLRAVEPNLRLGLALQSHLDQQQAGNVHIPVCQYRNTANYEQCIKYGSRKQIGEAIVMSGSER
jgi:Chondroitin N-acetylgalactosaminyltransferase